MEDGLWRLDFLRQRDPSIVRCPHTAEEPVRKVRRVPRGVQLSFRAVVLNGSMR